MSAIPDPRHKDTAQDPSVLCAAVPASSLTGRLGSRGSLQEPQPMHGSRASQA